MEHNKPMEQRLRSSICCCFGGHNAPGSPEDRQTPSLIRNSSTWIRSKALEIPELKGKCRGLISRMGRSRRGPGGDFKYDPLSYALNFDEGPDFDDGDGEISPSSKFRHRNFSSRLPSSPANPHPPPPPPSAAKEIFCS